MPGETFQTLKSKATQQAKQSGMSQSAAENYGSAMASQAAQVGGAATPTGQTSTGETTGYFSPEFFGGAQNTGADIEDAIKEALSGSTQAPLEQIAARKEAEKKMQEAGGVFNPQSGMVEYPQQTKLFEGLGSLSLDDIIDKAPSLLLKGIAGGAKGLQLLLDKAFKPQLEDFSNPNFLAVLDAAFKSGKLNKDEYTKKYEDLLDDVYSGQAKENLEAGLGSLDSEGLFDLAMEEATANVEPGSGTQRITDPKGFYLDDGKGILPQTTGGLANLAGLDVNQFTSGPGFNQQMVDIIFAARAELDRMGKNPMTGESQGVGQTGVPQTGQANIINPTQFGAFIGKPGPFIGNFVDSDGDGVDDRFQTGPGQPSSQPFVNPKAPLPGTSGIAQAVGVPAALNYANIAPQFTGSPYTNQGVSPAFLENLRRFYG